MFVKIVKSLGQIKQRCILEMGVARVSSHLCRATQPTCVNRSPYTINTGHANSIEVHVIQKVYIILNKKGGKERNTDG